MDNIITNTENQTGNDYGRTDPLKKFANCSFIMLRRRSSNKFNSMAKIFPSFNSYLTSIPEIPDNITSYYGAIELQNMIGITTVEEVSDLLNAKLAMEKGLD
jgi:hypothetical protein